MGIEGCIHVLYYQNHERLLLHYSVFLYLHLSIQFLKHNSDVMSLGL
jgi:hypothetical protein